MRASQAEEGAVWDYKTGKGLEVHSTFSVIQTNLDRRMSYIFLKIKICGKGSHVEFDLPFLVKHLAMKLQIMVVKLQKNILQSAFQLIHHLFTLK